MMRVEEYDERLWVDTVKADVEKMTRHILGGWEKTEMNRSYMDILADPNWKSLLK
jgi:hypothetical protein